MRTLLLTPPMIQLNAPYPATAYLTGFLRSRGYEAWQADPAIELATKLFSSVGLERIAAHVQTKKRRSPTVSRFLKERTRYFGVADAVLSFLQGKDSSLAVRIASRDFLPEGPRFAAVDEDADLLNWAFGTIGVADRAKYLGSLFLDDLADVVREGVDEDFSLSRYAERLATSSASFDGIEERLRSSLTLIDEILGEIVIGHLSRVRPSLVALTVPFPGNLYGALRIAQCVRQFDRTIKIALGGGYVSTELRDLREPRLFKYVDYVLLDDGERPLECLLEHLNGKREEKDLLRAFVLKASGEDGQRYVSFVAGHEPDVPFEKTGTPTYDGLPLDQYLSVVEMLNPMHRLWSDARWNKVMIAHGCYWAKCNFCDITLDYIKRFDVGTADVIVDRMLSLIGETGQTGFHFVDEAAPPRALKALSKRLIERGVTCSWWGNIRFEKTFDEKLAKLMAEAGCIAVTGGLEAASDRLLKLVNKGVTVEQVARVTRAFRDAGIMVHAYLMYGLPTETEQETVDSLERVRQLFAAECIQSAYWHRFSATAHSPIGKTPRRFGIDVTRPTNPKFAFNDLEFVDETGVDHDRLGRGLRKAVYNYMHGLGLDEDVRVWFDGNVPMAKVSRNLIAKAVMK